MEKHGWDYENGTWWSSYGINKKKISKTKKNR
jgi:hypothetical protein